MYDYIKGSLVELSPTELTLENNDIGYKILISVQTYSKLQGAESAQIFIYHHLKEDDATFYGFFEKKERSVFIHLISVSGIGPNTARMMLSSLSTDEISSAILTGDVNKIKSVKGIGLKTAQRAIIELKDKIGKTGQEFDLSQESFSSSSREEASSALVLLGFNKIAVNKVLDSIISNDPSSSLENLIKKALKLL